MYLFVSTLLSILQGIFLLVSPSSSWSCGPYFFCRHFRDGDFTTSRPRPKLFTRSPYLVFPVFIWVSCSLKSSIISTSIYWSCFHLRELPWLIGEPFRCYCMLTSVQGEVCCLVWGSCSRWTYYLSYSDVNMILCLMIFFYTKTELTTLRNNTEFIVYFMSFFYFQVVAYFQTQTEDGDPHPPLGSISFRYRRPFLQRLRMGFLIFTIKYSYKVWQPPFYCFCETSFNHLLFLFCKVTFCVFLREICVRVYKSQRP